jgi:hypothetical protein
MTGFHSMSVAAVSCYHRLMKWRLAAAILSLGAAVAVSAQTILLDNFSGGGTTGIIGGTSWVGNVALNGTTITVGDPAKNDNGWGIVGTTLNASSMNFLTFVFTINSGNVAPSLVIAFEDGGPDAAVFSIPTFSFTTGTQNTVQIPLTTWGNVNPAAITGWTIGGGTAGVVAFRMTFDNLSLSATAVPEPATSAALAGLGALGFVVWRRRRNSSVAEKSTGPN